MNYFLIGPSGVGKTTLIRQLVQEHEDIATFILDDLVCEWAQARGYTVNSALQLYNTLRSADQFFKFGKECMDAALAQNTKPHAVVDIGAGFLVSKLAHGFLQQVTSIALTASPEIAFQRFQQRKLSNRSFAEYKTTEFNASRQHHINSAKYVIHSDSLSSTDVLARFLDIISTTSNAIAMSESKNNVELFTDPNKHAPRIGLTLGETSAIRGYQGFDLSKNSIKVADHDKGLREKQEMVRPIMDNPWFAGKTVLDLGANAAYFCFSSVLHGASYADAVEIDKKYIKLVNDVIKHYEIPNIEIHDKNVMDYHRSADVTFAYALIHWIYSCTSDYGSLDQSIKKLSDLTRGILIVEWIDNEDSAIQFFNHTDYNKKIIHEPYNQANFEKALSQHFSSWRVLGQVKETRQVYVCFKTPEISANF